MGEHIEEGEQKNPMMTEHKSFKQRTKQRQNRGKKATVEKAEAKQDEKKAKTEHEEAS